MPRDPQPRGGRLRATIQGFRGTAFECPDGFGGLIEVLEFKDGADPRIQHRPGRTRYRNFALRRDRAAAPVLWKWWKTTTQGDVKPRQVVVTIHDARGRKTTAWQLDHCWPCAWRLVPVDTASPDSDYVEEVELVVADISLL